MFILACLPALVLAFTIELKHSPKNSYHSISGNILTLNLDNQDPILFNLNEEKMENGWIGYHGMVKSFTHEELHLIGSYQSLGEKLASFSRIRGIKNAISTKPFAAVLKEVGLHNLWIFKIIDNRSYPARQEADQNIIAKRIVRMYGYSAAAMMALSLIGSKGPLTLASVAGFAVWSLISPALFLFYLYYLAINGGF